MEDDKNPVESLINPADKEDNRMAVRIAKRQRKTIIVMLGILFFIYAVAQNNALVGFVVLVITWLLATSM